MTLQPQELQHNADLSASRERTRTEIAAVAAYLPAIATESADVFKRQSFADLDSSVEHAAEVRLARAALIDFCLSVAEPTSARLFGCPTAGFANDGNCC